jgi:hypothetical protein
MCIVFNILMSSYSAETETGNFLIIKLLIVLNVDVTASVV